MAVDRDLSPNRAMSRTRILAFKRLHLPYTEEILSVSHRATDDSLS